MKYKKGYKYQLTETYRVYINVMPDFSVSSEFIHLDNKGGLMIKRGYAWDGPSGPTIDTPNFMRGSLVHDALYQLIREGHLPLSMRDRADRLLQQMCIEDGMSRARAWWVYTALKHFGGAAADFKNSREVYEV